jgi:ABC-type branched-subunit amino acid transport system substrate-binding protein
VSRSPKALALLVFAVLLAGCLGGDSPSGSPRIPGSTLTIYSSLPAHGLSAVAARAVAAGERLALDDAGGRAAGRRVRLVRLDSTRPGERVWEPALVSANAKQAVDDATAVAYLGELNYGASAVSVPITNDHDVLQVSPGDGLASLTTVPPGRPQAGPARYYPKERRSFLRLTASDLRQAEALLARARRSGARRLAVVFDGQIYGRELASELLALARRDGPEPVAGEELRGDPTGMPGFVQDIAGERPDAVVYAGVAGPLTGPLMAALARGLPRVPVFATAGLLAHAAPLPVAPSTVEAVSTQRPAARLSGHARRLLRRVARRAGLASAGTEALYGYESMRLVLDAIDAAGPTRRGVIRAALTPRSRRSPVGRYDIHASGDVTPDRLALYRLRDGLFTFERELP